MFERPDLTDAYSECVDGAKDIARLCSKMLRLSVHMGFTGKRGSDLVNMCNTIAKYHHLDKMTADAVAFRDQVALVAIACRSLVVLTAQLMELIERVECRGRTLAGFTGIETQAELAATLALISTKCEKLLPLADLWLKAN